MFHELSSFPPQSRVWIYQADRPFSEAEQAAIEPQLQSFAEQWVSHNRQLKAAGFVMHNRFVVLLVDEASADASGCSIDKSVAFMKSLGAAYGRDFFNRLLFTYQSEGQLHTVTRDAFEQLAAEGRIDADTLVCDTLVSTKAALDTQFMKRLADSWHARLVTFA